MKHKNVEPQQGFFPQPVYMIGTVDESGKVDFAPVTWITSCSGDPPSIMIAMTKRMKTCENIIATNKFSANLANESMREIINYCGSVSGYEHNKVNEKHLEFYMSSKFGMPILNDSPWVFECEVINAIELSSTFLFISKIVNISADTSIPDTNYGKIDLKQLTPLIYSPSQYFALGEYLGKIT